MLCLLQGIKKWSKQVKFHTNVISNEEAIQDKTHFYEPYKIDLKKKTKIFAFLGLVILWIHTLYIWKIQLRRDSVIWGIDRILNSYANPWLCLEFAQLSPILPTPLMFIPGYMHANMETFSTASITIATLAILLSIYYKWNREFDWLID